MIRDVSKSLKFHNIGHSFWSRSCHDMKFVYLISVRLPFYWWISFFNLTSSVFYSMTSSKFLSRYLTFITTNVTYSIWMIMLTSYNPKGLSALIFTNYYWIYDNSKLIPTQYLSFMASIYPSVPSWKEVSNLPIALVPITFCGRSIFVFTLRRLCSRFLIYRYIIVCLVIKITITGDLFSNNS